MLWGSVTGPVALTVVRTVPCLATELVYVAALELSPNRPRVKATAGVATGTKDGNKQPAKQRRGEVERVSAVRAVVTAMSCRSST